MTPLTSPQDCTSLPSISGSFSRNILPFRTLLPSEPSSPQDLPPLMSLFPEDLLLSHPPPSSLALSTSLHLCRKPNLKVLAKPSLPLLPNTLSSQPQTPHVGTSPSIVTSGCPSKTWQALWTQLWLGWAGVGSATGK